MASKVFELLAHPDELSAVVQYKLFAPKTERRSDLRPHEHICYDMLELTSRSFSSVIQQLEGSLRDAVCVFYLVLRGLDTIEDDPTLSVDRKIPLLRDFYNLIEKEGWTFTENGPDEKDRHLLVRFDNVIAFYRSLEMHYRNVISDITRDMGAGMAKFCNRSMQDVNSVAEWEEYCHYVAGLVGIGLTQLFVQSGLETALELNGDTRLSNSMGLFLQKVNIIRDYREDVDVNRVFWPREVWSLYAESIGDFRATQARNPARQCLNHLITDALKHVPDVFHYLSLLSNRSIFQFCAIPQVMAIATLALCYDNGQVFEQNVKIRKGLAVRMIIDSVDMASVERIFAQQLAILAAKIIPASADVPVHATKQALQKAIPLLKEHAPMVEAALKGERSAASQFSVLVRILALGALFLALFCVTQ